MRDNKIHNNINILQKASPAKAGKRFASFMIDSIIILIVSYLIFLAGFEITKTTSSYVNNVEIVSNEIAYYNEYAIESHAVEFVDEANSVRKDSVTMVLENLSRSIYHSYKVFGNAEYPDFVIQDGDSVTRFGEATLTTDSVSYFYSQFVPNHKEYKIVDYGMKDEVDFIYDTYRNAFGENQAMFVYDRNTSDVPVLKSSAAYYLNYYLFISQTDDTGKIGEQYYSAYFNSYTYMLEGCEDLLIKSEPYYSEHYLVYQNAYFSQGRSVLYTLVISLVIANLICVLVPKLIFKNEQTLSRKMLSLGSVNADNKKVDLWKVIVRHVLELPMYTWIFIITMLFTPFNGVYDTLFMPIWNGSSVPFALVIFVGLIVYAIINSAILFTHYRQSLLDLALGVLVKDQTHLDEGDNDDQFEGKPL